MAGGASSNVGEVKRKLEALVAKISFNAVGKDQSLGRDMAAAVAVGISERSTNRQVDPFGEPWAANMGAYGERKRRQGLPVGTGPKRKKPFGRRMLSLVELKGEVIIGEGGLTLVIKYGTGEQTRRKAQWFTNGTEEFDGEPSGAKYQPARRFWGLDPALKEELRGMAREHVRKLVQDWRSS